MTPEETRLYDHLHEVADRIEPRYKAAPVPVRSGPGAWRTHPEEACAMSDYPIEFTLPGICHRWPYDGPIAAGHPYLATEGACCDLLIGDAHLIVTSLAQLDELEHALETIRDRARSWLPEGSAA